MPERYNIARDVCDKHEPDRLAMVWENWEGRERRVTFGELRALSNRFAHLLEAIGVERGDRVATLLPSLPETAAIFIGTYKRGAILLSLSVLYGDDGIHHRLSDSRRHGGGHRRGEPRPHPGRHCRDRPGDGRRAGDGTWTSTPGSSGSDEFEIVDTLADDPAQLYYSSGTTGKAKGILHAHRYLLAHEEFEFCHDVRDGELFHGSGEWAWAAGIAPLLGPWRYGASRSCRPARAATTPEEHLRFLAKHGVENMFTTPTALRAMTGVADAGKRYPLDKLRVTCSAGEPLNPEVIRWFRDQYGITVLDFYGLTESYPLCANFPTVEVREGSMGRPMPGWDVAILDEDERPVTQGERGEICLRARSNPHYPIGYWNRPEDTEEVFGGDWFHTKDAAQHGRGRLRLVRRPRRRRDHLGRLPDRPVRGGVGVRRAPGGQEAAAVASPDERRGTSSRRSSCSDGTRPDRRAGRTRSSASSASATRPTPIRARSSSSTTCRRRSPGKIRRVELRQQERERKGSSTPA